MKGVFDDSIEMSGGEKQKLMLARALYKDAPVIVLDEPTAALDPIAENELYMKYNELTSNKTSVYISHRLASFTEFEQLQGTSIYVSATPADWELSMCEGVVAEQLIRPTGLVDPPLEVRNAENQIDDLMAEIDRCVRQEEKVIVTTITKRMAEELSKYFDRMVDEKRNKQKLP